MAFVLKDRVRETTDTNGTGAIRVTGVVPGGYQTFNSALSNGDTTLVCVRNDAGQWQTFLGTWDSATQTLARTTAYEGSAGAGVNVNFSGESQEVWINYPAQWFHRPTLQTLTVGVASSSGGATFYGPLGGATRALTVSQSMILSGSTNGNVARFETAVSGTTTANPAIFTWSASDNLQAAAGMNYRIASISYGGTSFQGGRNGEWINVNSTADCTNGGDNFYVAHAPWWRARHYHNGYPGAERGGVWGSNPLGWLGNSGTIGARRMRGVQGQEVNFGAVYNTFYRTGTRNVEWGDSALGGSIGVGMWQDASHSYGRLTGADLPGVLTLHALGDSLGDWPLRATGATIMETQPTQIASPASYSAAIGFNLPDVTFDYGAMWFPGFFVAANGDVGGRTVGGTTVQTVSAILAKTAVVGSVTVARGGLFIGKPTLTFSAPVSGTTATGTVNAMAADWPFAMTGAFGARGTNYTVGDVLTDNAATGTASTRFSYTVRAVDATGQIIDMEPTTPGSYTVLPTNPVTLTGGTGTGAQVAPYWTILSVTVSGAGTGYSEQAPPAIAVSGGSGQKFRNAILIPQMTATQGQLQLNNGKINVAGIPTSSAGLSSGDVWNDGGTLKVVA